MGGVVDCGVGTDTKASPRRAAIDESQTQMPMKADGTVERMKEFEFLVNGGDVLTYKVSQAGSISVQSTSIRDQLAEQYIISEAKSSFALAPSPHGDSVESSGRPGGSSGREPNIADNLLLFDGENSNIGGDRNLKFNRKRGNGGPLEQCSQIDGCDNPKEADDSVILGFKRQAYARRNRSRSSRDSTHVGSTDVSPADTNKLTNFPSSHSGSLQGLLCGKLEDHALSSISNSKPNGNIVSKTSVSKDQLDMELDTVQTRHTCSDTLTGGAPEGEAETKPSDNNQDSHEVPEKDHNDAALQSSNYIENKALSSGFLSATLGSIVDTKEIKTNEKVDCHDITGKNVKVINDDFRRKVLNVKKNTEPDPSLVMMSADTDGKAKTDECSILRTADRSSVGECNDHHPFQEALSVPDKNCLSDKSQCVAIDALATVNDESRAVLPTPEYSSIQIKDEVKLRGSKTDMQTEVRPSKNPGGVQLNGEVIMNVDRLQENCFDDTSCSADKAGMNTSNLAELSSQHANAILLMKGSITNSEFQNGPAVQLKLAKKAREDAILKEARIIEANLRRAGNNSLSSVSLEKRKKCHWDFVLEEMAWMANDFMQERVWKMVAASQVSRTIVNSGLFMFQEENMHRKQRRIARTVAKAIMHFWHSADIFRSGGKELIGTHGSDLCKTWKVNGVDAEKHKASNYNEAEHSVQILKPAVQGYAVRFLNYISSTSIDPVLAEAPTTPETNDAGIIGVPWEDQHSEESLFYTVPPGAMCKYRESMELAYLKKTNNASHKDEWELSNCDSVADGPRQNAYEEDASENCTYFFPGATERGLSLKYANRKKKILQHKSNAGRLYAVGSDLLYENRAEGKFGNQPLMITGKRPSSTVNVGSVPTKRVRTAARQRASPFDAGVAGSMQMTSKTDVSSGDTNSFQDDQSSPYGVSHPRRNLEVETTANFDRQLSFDGCEISSKSKKKKKPKHLGYKNSLNLTGSGALILPGKGSLYEQKLLPDSMIRLEQRDHLKKRLESQRFESNGNLSVGQYAQHVAKKPKLLKQFPESSSDAIVPFTGSVPSPVASQMSNMSGPTKFIKMNKDRGRKSKGMKVVAGQSGSANPWSNFEEQALVVLVHDLGTHWELISDAMNSTLLFKRVFRSPSECKERHKILMESSVDGADSAEDSGSSQQYRSTLPGIPKGSARQLFQRLQAPVEEDTLKAHFEKIISIGQKLHSFRTLNDTQAPEKITPAHSSHVVALSQMCPNNLNRSAVLTPLDLCDTTTSNPDAPTHGYQGSQTNSLPITSHQSSSSLVIPISGGSTMLQGSPSLVLSNGLPSPSRSLSGQARDSQRYGMPRPNSLPADDQQRMQQYSQMISGRSIQQPNMSIPGNLSVGGERSVRMLPGANGMGMMCGINRGMPVPRPGFQGMNSPGMINMVSTGGMLSGNALGMQNPTNVHPSSVSGPGNSMLRPRDTLQMPRPGQNTDEHRQMMMQELQHQVSQGNCQSVAPFSGISAPYSNATVAPPVQAFPVQNQQPHQMPQQSNMFGNPHHPHIPANNHSSSQQQAYAMRAAKERQVQQRMMPQPQHPFAGSNMVSSLPSGSQIQQVQSSSSGISVPSSQAQHKQQQMQRSAQSGNGMPNPMMKQRQRQQVQQQQPRPQQQQRPISQQQAKMMKGLGRGGTMLMHQNLSVEGSHPGGLSTAPKNQVSEKHPIQQSQGFFPSSSVLNTPLPQSANQPKMYPRPLPQTSKQMSLMPSMSDNINQGSTQLPPGHTLVASHQPPVSASLPLTSQPQQRQSNQSQQNMQRLTLHQNRQINSDSRMQSSTDQVYVNQMIPATSSPQCADSSAPVVSTGMQWKPEPSYDISQPIQTSHLAGSPQENMIGTEALMSSSNQGLGQRQFSGSLPLHKHNIGGQWQQQPQPQQQQSQLQHRQGGAPGNLYARPSNSGAG